MSNDLIQSKETDNTAASSSCSKVRSIRMIEFFSGIGGMRLGVEQALKNHSTSSSSFHTTTTTTSTTSTTSSFVLSSCHAYEISNCANSVYRYYFHPSTTNHSDDFTVQTKLVEQLKPKDLDGKADLWTMSPPCQPFTSTRLAKQLDSNDARCNGLKGIISLLNTIHTKPTWILLENVKGFVGSDMLQDWYDCLEFNGYSWQEYILCPTQLGIPNCRTRYYIICERSTRFPSNKRGRHDDSSSLWSSLLLQPTPSSFLQSPHLEKQKRKCIQDYILTQDSSDTAFQSVLLPNHILEKEWVKDLGIVTPRDTITHCFTAAYARQLHKATGSILLMDDPHHDPHQDTASSTTKLDRSNMLQYKHRLRRFLPCELLRLFGFPDDFKFPLTDISLEQQYKLIGNSVNVNVVAYVAGILLRSQECC
jgi:tRNA (cytosine38-C5)-methyltransferase